MTMVMTFDCITNSKLAGCDFERAAESKPSVILELRELLDKHREEFQELLVVIAGIQSRLRYPLDSAVPSPSFPQFVIVGDVVQAGDNQRPVLLGKAYKRLGTRAGNFFGLISQIGRSSDVMRSALDGRCCVSSSSRAD